MWCIRNELDSEQVLGLQSHLIQARGVSLFDELRRHRLLTRLSISIRAPGFQRIYTQELWTRRMGARGIAKGAT